MAQPGTIEINGVPATDGVDNGQQILPGKRKREDDAEVEADHDASGDEIDVEMNGIKEDDDDDEREEPDEKKPTITTNGVIVGDEKELVKAYFEILTSLDVEPAILKRPLGEPPSADEPHAKRQKSSEPPSKSSIAEKVANGTYEHLEEMANDVLSAAKDALHALEATDANDDSSKEKKEETASQIRRFKEKAYTMFRREQSYPRTAWTGSSESQSGSAKSDLILSLIGYAPQERRLFSSLPASAEKSWTEANLPLGVSVSRVVPSSAQERVQTIGELFAPPRALPPLQPPKQPKTQAKGNTLDFYHPGLADIMAPRGSSYFTTKLPAGHYLDYSNATPSWQTKTKRHERAQSLAGKKPSDSEVEQAEMDSLFRGAFSSFAPCKDDSSSLVPSSIAGKVWWQQAGQKGFQSMIEIEYYQDDDAMDESEDQPKTTALDEKAVQEAIDGWDDAAIDPTLEDVMGTKRDSRDKEADEILDEVSDMIETLASYQRIRNLTLPNSQNRQSSDPVAGDMLANSGPEPSEEEQATYQVLKAQLALIIKTLPPYAVARLNGDQLEDLLISTKMQVQTDQYKGVLEEDEAGVQARIRAQQQQQQQQAAAAAAAAAQATPRPGPQRTPSVGSAQYYPAGNQYGTPNRTPSHSQQYFRPQMATPNYQQNRSVSQPQFQQRPPQPNQYTRQNGYANQYATQLAKAQTPYGHQNMQHYAGQQQRPPQYGQMSQQGTPNARYGYQQGFPPQPGGAQSPPPGSYTPYTNGSGVPQRTMSPHVQHQQRPPYSPSPNMQQQQRYGTPNQAMAGQMNRFPSQGQSNPGLTGYHTVIPEAQQQRIIDQAKARVAAQERSASFTDKIAQPGYSGMNIGAGSMDASRLAAARASYANQQKPTTPTGQRNGTPTPQHVPLKVTPVPVPVIPGAAPSPKPL